MLSRRNFLKLMSCAGVATLGAGLLYSVTPQVSATTLEDEILETLKNAGYELEKGKDYAFYPDCQTITVFLPDEHTDEYQEEQKERIVKLYNNFQLNGISVVGLGLEGIVRGKHNSEEIKELSKLLDRHREKVSHLVNNLADTFGKMIKKASKEADQKIRYIYQILDYVNFDGFLGLRTPVGRLDSPGASYVDLIDVEYYGLEHEKTDKVAGAIQRVLISTGNIIVAKAAKDDLRKLSTDYPELENYIEKITFFDTLESRSILQLEKEKQLIEREFEHVPKVLDDISNLWSSADADKRKELRTRAHQLYWEYELSQRTKEWVRSISNFKEGVTLVVGGFFHTPYFRQYAQEQRRSYVILPKLDVE